MLILSVQFKICFCLQGSIDSVAMTHLSGQTGDTSSRGYMYGWMWWKPQEEFVSPPPPPSYDDAVANDRFVPYSYKLNSLSTICVNPRRISELPKETSHLEWLYIASYRLSLPKNNK